MADTNLPVKILLSPKNSVPLSVWIMFGSPMVANILVKAEFTSAIDFLSSGATIWNFEKWSMRCRM